MKLINTYLICIFIFLSSCNLAPKYDDPCIEVPEEWKTQPWIEEEIPQVDFWWEVFHNEQLNQLELIALRNNKELKTAYYRIEEAWATAGINKSALYPTVSLNPSYTDTGVLFKLFLPPNTQFAALPVDIYRINLFNYALPAIMNYELDLWGKNRNTYYSSVYQAQAQGDAYCAAILTLTAEVANAYFQLCSLDRQIQLLQQDKDLIKKQFDLLISRNTRGLSNEIETANSEVLLSNAEANYHNALRQRVLLENVIAALLGEPASLVHLEATLLEDKPPRIPAGVPSNVLFNRPDVREAEKICKAQNRMIGVARASYFPSLSITGTLGYVSPDFHQFLRWISRYWSMGASIAQPLFEGGALESNLEGSWARFHQATSEYQQTVIIAFREVEDALNNIEHYDLQLNDFQRAVEANKLIENRTRKRNSTGLVNTFDVINSQRSLINAQLNETVVLENTYLSTVQLIKAIGGRW